MRFEIYEKLGTQVYGFSVSWNGKREWYWRLRAANNRIIADGSESYASRSNCRRAIHRLAMAFISTGHCPPIVEVES